VVKVSSSTGGRSGHRSNPVRNMDVHIETPTRQFHCASTI
jgi:hypothetical protein